MKYVIYLIVLSLIIMLSVDGCSGTKWEFAQDSNATEVNTEESGASGESDTSDESQTNEKTEKPIGEEEQTVTVKDFGELGLDTISIDENWSEYILYNGNKIYFGTPLSETPFENVPNNLAVNDDPRMNLDIVVKVPIDKYMHGALQTEDGLTSLEVCIMHEKNENDERVFSGLYYRSVKGDMNIKAGNATSTIGLGNSNEEVTTVFGQGNMLDEYQMYRDRRLTCWQKDNKCLHIGYGAESLKKGIDQTNDYVFEIYVTEVGSSYACEENNN